MIELLPFTEEDINQLIEWLPNEKLLNQWAGSLFSFPLTKRSVDWYIRGTNVQNVSEAFIYKVADKETGKAIGHISLGSISWKNKAARITRVLIGDEESKGKGYCRQMVEAISIIGFEKLDLHRISLGVYDTNYSAIKCYEKAGFIVEGRHRDVMLHENEYWSMVEMAMLKSDWEIFRLNKVS